MMRNRCRRPTSNYYAAWRIYNELENDAREIQRYLLIAFVCLQGYIQLRSYLRKILDPAKINEREFQKRYGLSKTAFKFLTKELQQLTTLRSTKRVKVEHKILCALSFYRTGSYQRIVGMSKHLGQTTVSKYVNEVTLALNSKAILGRHIQFPVTQVERNNIKELFYTKYGIPGVIGCVDGSHFHISTPNKDQEHLFFCRKQFYSLNVQMICDSNCKILNVNAKFGGPTHDSFIWENSLVNGYMQKLHLENEHVWLLGDSGYPQRPWLMTPIPDAVDGSPEARYTEVHGKARVVIENTFGRLKNRWRCVCKHRTLHYKPEKCAKIVMAVSVLHNIASDFNVPEVVADVDDSPETSQLNGRHDVHVEVEGNASRDALIRGRALRSLLVERINRLHSLN